MYTSCIGITNLAPDPSNPVLLSYVFTAAVNSPGGAVLVLSDNVIRVRFPKNYHGEIQINFQIFDPTYTLVGLLGTSLSGGDGTMTLAMQHISLYRNSESSQLTLFMRPPTTSPFNINFYIGVQNVKTGSLYGLDPEIEAEIEP